MKLCALIVLLLCNTCAAHTIDQVLDAINQVEATGQRDHVPRGDHGHAIGGLQIHRSYWVDSRVDGTWEMCEDYPYSVRVAKAYFKRYEPDALEPRVIAMLHHYGPGWRSKNTDPDAYWRKVQSHLPKE